LGPLDLSIHLLGFVAPAFVLAVIVAFGGRLVLPRNSQPQRWWMPVTLNFLAGTAASVGGLVLFGRDGKMLTYAALVLAVATAQWLGSRAWRS
jgi:hypothetical protein